MRSVKVGVDFIAASLSLELCFLINFSCSTLMPSYLLSFSPRSHSSSPLVFMHSLPPSPVFSLAGLADSVSEDSSHVPLLLLLRLFLLLPSSMSLSFFHSRIRAGTNATHLSVPLPLLLHPSLCTHGCVPTPPAPPGQEHVIAFANNPHRLRSSEITDSG